jgi:DNA polymerase-3 subunit alpha
MVHLHIKSEYSLLTSAARVSDIPKKAAELSQSAVAITDTAALFCAPQFFRAAKSAGVKPILGLEMKSSGAVLLCKNETGFHNLCKIASDEKQNRAVISENGGGLIGLSGGRGSEVYSLILDGALNEAKKAVLEYKAALDDFYIEIFDHNLPEEKAALPLLLRLAADTDCELCATNDVFFTEKSDASTREILLRIKTGTILSSKDSGSLPNNEFYIKSTEEMTALFRDLPDAIKNTDKIAEACEFDFDALQGGIHLPRFEVPGGLPPEKYLSALAHKGAEKRYGDKLTPNIIERLRFELSVIEKMGFTDYFLIVWDFIKFAKQSGIPVGTGRGSGVGSAVAYCTGITNIDPIKYGLLFERSLNPERVSLPDFDVDFGDRRRFEVKEYLKNRYGEANVADIVTFGTLKAKSAIRDVVRIMGLPQNAGDYLCNKIPQQGTISIFKNENGWTETDPTLVRILEAAEKIEFYPKNQATHASGVIITDKPILDYMPVIKTSSLPLSQFPMNELEPLGLVKIDILGSKEQTIIDDTIISIRKTRPDFSDSVISANLEDKATYDLLAAGQTAGIFQFESEGITKLLVKIRPKNLEDLLAAIALYRPGPMDKIPEYLENRKNPTRRKYLHPLLENILSETYGIAIYQEQAMKIAREMAGFSYGRADLLRRAMAKKNAAAMESEKAAFLEGAAQNGVPQDTALKVFGDIEKFAGYAFNKSHAAAYAYISYQTAFLKTHFPTEFYAALLTANNGSDKDKKAALYSFEMKKRRIRILPPDIMRSESGFAAEAQGLIRFGLCNIKGVGSRAADECIKIRSTHRITSAEEFCKHIDTNLISRKTVEALILSGAFDVFGVSRKQLMHYLPVYLDAANESRYRNISGQTDFFSLTGSPKKAEDKKISEFSNEEIKHFEQEYCGITFDG